MAGLYLNVESPIIYSGRVRVGAECAILQHPGVGGADADRDRPVLLRQGPLQEPERCSGVVGDKLREHTGDVYGEAGAPGVQRVHAMHRRHLEQHTAAAAAGEVPHVRPLLLGQLRTALLPHHPSPRLPAARKAAEQSAPRRRRRLLIDQIINYYYLRLFLKGSLRKRRNE